MTRRVGIVGSRRRATLADFKIVCDVINKEIQEHGEIVIVSGGCPRGADSFAEQIADALHLRKDIRRVQTHPPASTRWEFTQRAYARNREIAEISDIVYALVSHDRTGGTENTISHCLDLETEYVTL